MLQSFLKTWLDVIITAIFSAFIIWPVARWVAVDKTTVTYMRSFRCALYLSLISVVLKICLAIAAGILGFILVLAFGVAGIFIALGLAVLAYLFLFLKLGASTVNSSFDMEGGGSTILVAYLLIYIMVVVTVGVVMGVNEFSQIMAMGSERSSSSSAFDDGEFDEEEAKEFQMALEKEMGKVAIAPVSTPDPSSATSFGATPAPAAMPTPAAPPPPSVSPDQIAQADAKLKQAAEYWGSRQAERAVTAGQEALTIYRAAYPADHPQIVAVQSMLQLAQQNRQKAESKVAEAAKFWEEDETQKALDAAEEALEMYRGMYQESHPSIVATRQMIAMARQQLGLPAAAGP